MKAFFLVSESLLMTWPRQTGAAHLLVKCSARHVQFVNNND